MKKAGIPAILALALTAVLGQTPQGMAGEPSGGACRNLPPEERLANPCCNTKLYSCYQPVQADQPMDVVLNETSEGSSAQLVRISPLRFILKKRGSDKDQSRLKDAPVGALYRETAVKEQGSPEPATRCLNVLTLDTKEFVRPAHRSDPHVGYISARVEGRKKYDLFGLKKRTLEAGSAPLVTRDPATGRISCTGQSDLAGKVLMKDVEEIVPLVDNGGTASHGFTLVSYDGSTARVWSGEFTAMTLPSVVSFGVVTMRQHGHDPLLIFTDVSFVKWLDSNGWAGQWRPIMGPPPSPKHFARDAFGINGVRQYP